LNTSTSIGHLRNNSRTSINRLNFLWFLNLVFIVLSFFFIPVLLTPSSLFSYPYSYPLHSPFSSATTHCSLSQLLFLPPLIHSFFCLHLPFPSSSNLSPYCPSLLHIHHLLTSLLYQLHTTPAPCNPLHKPPPLQQQKYTQRHIRATKPSSLLTHLLTPFPAPHFIVPLLPVPQNL
jgi:hypothetical protein